jgi:lipid-binding SYLF domain-containing protein
MTLIMKKLFPVAIFALLSAALTAQATPSRADLVTEVDSCYAILQEFMGKPETAIPPAVWQKAHAVLIVNQFKGGLIIGLKDGYGVLMVKKSDGRWSLPVLVSANEASLGFQIGGKSVETVCIITDDQTPRLLFKQRVNIGVDAKAVAGPHAADIEKNNHPILSTPVLVYTRERGLYAGATLRVGRVARNDDANFALYSTNETMPELLYSDWVQAPQDVQSLMTYVQRLAP